MNITINGLKLGEDTKYLIGTPVVGLSKPPIRTADGDYAGRDGGYVSAQFYGKRRISITGWIKADTCEENEDMRANLASALAIRQLLPVFIRTFTNNIYLAEAYPIDLQMDITSPKLSAFKIDLVCPNPYLFDGGDGVDPDSGWIEQTITKFVGGGYVTPYSLPVQWAPGTQPNIITNTGDSYIYPQLKLNGKFTNPRITNITENAFIELNVTTTTGDEIIIDMAPERRTITLNGGSILASRTSESSWWGLRPGDNIIELTSDAGDDADTAVVRWRAQFTGI